LFSRKAAVISTVSFLRNLVRASGLVPEGNGSVALTDIFRLSPTRFDANPAPARLVAEPAPADGTFERGTLVLVHGNYWKDAIGQRPDPNERTFLFEPMRGDPLFEEVRRLYRVHLFQYPTHLDVKASAAALATQLRDVIPASTARPDVTVIAHSLGGLVARHALQADDLAPRVRDLITLATPHHGTVLASLLMADSRIRKKVGLFGFFCQRMSRRIWPITPGMQGMAYDNLDSLISHDVTAYGAHENTELAHLNRTDRIAGKITALMGRVHESRWLESRNLWDQIPRFIMGRLNPIFRGLDPLVHLESGLGLGLSIRDRHPIDRLDHETIATDGKSREIVFDMLLRK